MFWSFLLYPTLSAQATENDGAVIIKLGGEVVSVDSKAESIPVAAPISPDVVHMDITELGGLQLTVLQYFTFRWYTGHSNSTGEQCSLELLHYNRLCKAMVGP